MARMLKLASIDEASMLLKALQRTKTAKAGAKALKKAKKQRAKAKRALLPESAPVDPRHALLVEAFGKGMRKGMRERSRRPATKETTAPMSVAVAEPLTSAELWDRRGDVLFGHAAATSGGVASPYWANYVAGNPLSAPLAAYSAGPSPLGGDAPFVAVTTA